MIEIKNEARKIRYFSMFAGVGGFDMNISISGEERKGRSTLGQKMNKETKNSNKRLNETKLFPRTNIPDY